MAQLTAGFYYTRSWRLIQLLSSSVIGGVTVWLANVYGSVAVVPPGAPLGVIGQAQFAETGFPLPQTNVPPIPPLAIPYNPANPVTTFGSVRMGDIMWPIGSVPTTIGRSA